MKGFIYSSDPSGRAFVIVWSLFMGAGGLFGAYNGFTNPGDLWIGLIFLGIGSLHLGLLVRTWGRLSDVFVDVSGVTIVHNNSEQTFSWNDVDVFARVYWPPFVLIPPRRVASVYRLSFRGTDVVAYFLPDRSGGRLIRNSEDMIGMIKREIREARVEGSGAI